MCVTEGRGRWRLEEEGDGVRVETLPLALVCVWAALALSAPEVAALTPATPHYSGNLSYRALGLIFPFFLNGYFRFH